jgi:hypothetical protein
MKLIVSSLFMLVFSVSMISGASAEGDADGALEFHGYGELHYGNTNKPGKTDMMDNHRLVLGWSYAFSDRIRFHAEIDFEHAAQEMELEFAYIDFLINDAFNVRAGTMLMPVGYLNEFHEPPRFYSVERPYVQKNVIPTTWQEGGVGIFGTLHNATVQYRAYIVSSLDAATFTASSGIRKGRGRGAEAASSDLAVVGRLDYSGLPALRLGVSGYTGNGAHENATLGDARTSLIEADARWYFKGLELTGLYTHISIDDADKIFLVTGEAVGETIVGSYIEAAYHLGRLFLPDPMNLVAFGRFEQYNTQDSMPMGVSADPKNDADLITLGVSYFPLQNVAVKADVENWKTDDGKSWEQFNMGLGYMF